MWLPNNQPTVPSLQGIEGGLASGKLQPATAGVLRQLCSLWALGVLEAGAGDLLADGYLSGSSTFDTSHACMGSFTCCYVLCCNLQRRLAITVAQSTLLLKGCIS